MDWLRRNVSSSSLTKAKKNPFQSESEAMETSTWLEAFKSHWIQAEKAMMAVHPLMELQKGPNFAQNGKATGQQPISGDLVTEVFRHFEQMNIFFLTELGEQSGESQLAPILDFIFSANCYDKVVEWGLGAHMAEFTDFSKMSLLKLFEALVSQPQQSLLVHKPVLTPLLKLLDGCSRLVPSDVEKHFVVVLNQVCVNISHDTTLLEFFFIPQQTESGPPKFSVFTLLIDFLYRDGNIGQLARDALLLILAVSRQVDSVGLFIADHSNFCPVVATGLNGLFSMLPRKITVGSDDWSRLTNEDIETIPYLQDFFGALEFCNAVIQVGHKSVVDQLLDYIHQGFLVPVLTSALLENSVEDVIAATSYLELFLRTVTEVSFMKVFVKFILCENHNGVPLLETLVTRISSNSRLCLVSLSLFGTLLSLHCEDLMYELILKYLAPCTHLMVSHTKVIRDYDMYGETAERFLQLIPTCCRSSRSNSLLENEGHQTETFDDGGNVATGSKSKFSFISPTENGIEYGTDPSLTSDSSGSDYYGFDANEADITDYLHSANWAVHRSYASCQGWSLPYDGDVPDPLGFRDDETLSPTSSNDSNSGLSSNNSVPLPSVGPPKTPPGPTMPGFFSRQANVRKSVRTNSYFGVRHSSALYIGSVPEGFSHVDLSLGPGEWAVDLEKFEEDEMFGEEEKRMTEPEEESSQLVADQIKTKSELNSAASSAQSSPAKQANRMGASMPTDYFKLAYDEDSLPERSSASDSQDESESNSGQMLSFSFVGFSQIEDVNTFIEVLHRVAPSKTAMKSRLEDNLEFLDSAYNKFVKQENLNESELTLSEDMTVIATTSSDVSFRPGSTGNPKMDPKQISPSTDSGIGGLSILRGSFKNPNIGPFLSVLMHKLENMMQNSLFVNLQLTAVVSCLAAYPQPLIHSFLLNHQVVFQPSIRSLWQILSSLKKKIDSYVYTVENFETLLWKGRKFLVSRESKYLSEQTDRSQSRKSRGNSLLQTKELDVVESTHSSRDAIKKPHRYGVRPLEFHLNWHGQRNKRVPSAPTVTQAVDEAQLVRTKNVVYCAIVLEEFLKELAAISLEHNVAQKQLYKCEEFLGH